ncbi:MAG: hypothetical protein ABSE73_20080 [Planctomycetota bacterium]
MKVGVRNGMSSLRTDDADSFIKEVAAMAKGNNAKRKEVKKPKKDAKKDEKKK